MAFDGAWMSFAGLEDLGQAGIEHFSQQEGDEVEQKHGGKEDERVVDGSDEMDVFPVLLVDNWGFLVVARLVYAIFNRFSAFHW